VTEEEIGKFLETVNETYPSANLNRNDVQFAYAGLLPVVPNSGRTGAVRLVTRHRIHDHQREDGIEALVSVIGVKFTEARYVAERTVDLVLRKLGRNAPRAVTAVTPVQGGQIEQFDDFLLNQIRQAPDGVPVEIMRPLVYRYGSGTSEVMKYLDEDVAGFKSIGGDDQPEEPSSRLLRGEVLHAVRAEMAQTLSDVVFRRTEVGTLGDQTDARLDTCAGIMAAEMDWDKVRTERQLEKAKSYLRSRNL
jgi:glycerol-3-phosphate dehydrogenase